MRSVLLQIFSGRTCRERVKISRDVVHVSHVGLPKHLIECFHSRGQDLSKFIATKESVYIRKEFNFYGIYLENQHGGHFIVLGTPRWPP